MNIILHKILSNDTNDDIRYVIRMANAQDIELHKRPEGYIFCPNDSIEINEIYPTLKEAFLGYLRVIGYDCLASNIKQIWSVKAFKDNPEQYVDCEGIYQLKAMYLVVAKDRLENEPVVKELQPTHKRNINTRQLRKPVENWLPCVINKVIQRLLTITVSEPKQQKIRKPFKSVMNEVRYLYRKVYVTQWEALWQKWNTPALTA